MCRQTTGAAVLQEMHVVDADNRPAFFLPNHYADLQNPHSFVICVQFD